jgi:IMP dehydrogenase
MKYLDYEDVWILPQYSEVRSRSHVDTSTMVFDRRVEVPVVSANMDTVTEGDMALSMGAGGALGAIHRFMDEPKTKMIHSRVLTRTTGVFVTVGVKPEEMKPRAKLLYELGARWFIVDVANGASIQVKETVEWLSTYFGQELKIVVGNIATGNTMARLAEWPIHGVKVGIACGSVCRTRNVTGVTQPQFSAVRECVTVNRIAAARRRQPPKLLIADGGIREIGDIAKALGAGADLVMVGRLLAGCSEAPLEGIYRGMASIEAMKTIRESSSSLPTPEGVSVLIPPGGSAGEVVRTIRGGLASAMSYSNARNLDEFRAKVQFSTVNGPLRLREPE